MSLISLWIFKNRREGPQVENKIYHKHLEKNVKHRKPSCWPGNLFILESFVEVDTDKLNVRLSFNRKEKQLIISRTYLHLLSCRNILITSTVVESWLCSLPTIVLHAFPQTFLDCMISYIYLITSKNLADHINEYS